MKLKRFLLTALMLSLILCSVLPGVSAATIVDSGSCGNDLTWTLDSEGTLTISGTGPMEYGAFEANSDIKKVVIKEGVTSIGERAFYECHYITSVSIPNTVTSIDDDAFNVCVGLTEITIPGSVRNIGTAAFDSCRGLKTVTISEGVQTIGASAFANCESLKTVTIPGNIERIGMFAFSYCSGLTSVTISEGVADIGEGAFQECSSLKKVTLPSTLTYIGNNAFYYCSSLESIVIPEGVTQLNGYTFAYCSRLKSISLPESLTVLGESEFSDCDGLTDIQLPSGLTSIGEMCFCFCDGITEITFPASMKTIGDNIFYESWGVTTIIFMGDAPQISSNAFSMMCADAYYPANNSTWDSSVKIGYGGGLTWKEQASIVITAQPKTTYAKSGTTAKVTLSATGDGLTYQWYARNASATRYFKTSSIADSYAFTMNSTTKDRLVYCIITDQYGNSVKSNTVVVRMAATITKQPVSTKVKLGDMATVSLEAVGDELEYEWYQAIAGSASFTKTSTFTGNTYSIEMTESRNGRQVYCVVTDKYGNSARSDVVTLQIQDPPVITTQPSHRYVRLGQKASVSVEASGDGLTYQWYIKNSGGTKYYKSSITSSTYSVIMSESTKDRLVYCVVTDMYGNSVKSNTVILRMAATITTQPVNASAEAGQKVSVSVSALGNGLKYQWYVKNPGNSSFVKSSITKAAYSCTMSEAISGRQVYCVVTDKYGYSETSETVTLGIPVQITTQPTTGYAANGGTARLSLKASGDGLTYQWYFKNAGESSYTKSSITKATYGTTMNSKSRDRLVYCVVTDMYGNSVKSNTVILRMTASITTQPVDVMAAEGSKASVSVGALGDGLTYTWYYANPGSDNFYKTSAFTGDTYSITMAAARDGRRVYCVITDKYGNSVTTNTVTLSME